jgi:hypothetical protein
MLQRSRTSCSKAFEVVRRSWCHEEMAGHFYILTMRIFDAMIEHQAGASKLKPSMGDLLRYWVSFLP